MRSINTGNLNKQYILSKVSQVSIFSNYLNLPENVILHCIETGEHILSPIREDHHPTCGFKYDAKGRLRFKDFAGYFWGDCFDLVALIMSNMYKPINISNKQDFIKVLRHITFMFKDIFYGKEKDINLALEISDAIVNIKNIKPIIEIVVRNWQFEDKDIWNKFGIELHDLNTEFIYPVDQYYINRTINPEPKYYYRSKDPCYAYWLGKDRNNIDNIKLYFPLRGKGETRFITNSNHLEGIHGLNKNDYDIICVTKSTKDRVAIKKIIKDIASLYRGTISVNIGVINIPHETYKLRQSDYDWLKSKLNDNGIICSLMDNDRVGMSMAWWLRRNYIITPLLIPKSTNNKDAAEYREKQGLKQIVKPTINIINNIKKYEQQTINKYYKVIRVKKQDDTHPF